MGTEAQGSSGSQAAEGLSATAQQILAQAGVTQSGTADDPSTTTAAQPQEFTIDDGGVQRKVPLSELTTAYQKREQLSHMERLVKQQMAEISDIEAIRQMRGHIEALGPAEKAKVLSILQGQNLQETQGDEDGIDDLARQLTPQRRQPASDPRLDRMEQAVQAMATYLNQNLQHQQQATIREQVKAQLTQFPVFSQGEDSQAIAALAEDSVMNQIAANPQIDMVDAVKQAAQRLQSLRQNAQREILGGANIRGPINGLPPIQKGGANGKALQAGDIRRAAEAYLQSLPRR